MTAFAVFLAAYGAVTIQVTALAAWPLLGGQPHLIALGSVLFLLFRQPALGLWWVLVGGTLYDLLLPARFGTTLVPLVAAYLGVVLLARWVVETLPWWGGLAIGLMLLLASELPLAALSGGWQQLGHDLVAGACLLVPVLTTLASVRRPALVIGRT